MNFLVPTLSRYFFKRYMVTFLTYCLAILLVVLLIDFNESGRRLSGAENYTVLTGLLISALRVDRKSTRLNSSHPV